MRALVLARAATDAPQPLSPAHAFGPTAIQAKSTKHNEV